MVSHYKRKTERQTWSESSMKEAILAVENKQMGWLKASKIFNVPQATLRRRFQDKNKIAKGVVKKLGRPSYLPSIIEKKLVDHIINLKSKCFELTMLKVQKLAYEFAEEAHIPHHFNKKKRLAGWDWLVGFCKRNPQLSLRSSEQTSVATARTLNKPQIKDLVVKCEIDEFKEEPLSSKAVKSEPKIEMIDFVGKLEGKFKQEPLSPLSKISECKVEVEDIVVKCEKDEFKEEPISLMFGMSGPEVKVKDVVVKCEIDEFKEEPMSPISEISEAKVEVKNVIKCEIDEFKEEPMSPISEISEAKVEVKNIIKCEIEEFKEEPTSPTVEVKNIIKCEIDEFKEEPMLPVVEMSESEVEVKDVMKCEIDEFKEEPMSPIFEMSEFDV